MLRWFSRNLILWTVCVPFSMDIKCPICFNGDTQYSGCVHWWLNELTPLTSQHFFYLNEWEKSINMNSRSTRSLYRGTIWLLQFFYTANIQHSLFWLKRCFPILCLFFFLLQVFSLSICSILCFGWKLSVFFCTCAKVSLVDISTVSVKIFLQIKLQTVS